LVHPPVDREKGVETWTRNSPSSYVAHN
jgi:hypothetical protein